MSLRLSRLSLAIAIAAITTLPACGDDTPSGVPDAATADGSAPDSAAVTWPAPTCTIIRGTGAVTYTLDEGAHLTPTEEPLSGVVYTMGLVALDSPGLMLAAFDDGILHSTDSGCSWSRAGDTAGTLHLVAALADRAYGFVDNGTSLVRIDAAGASPSIVPLPLPGFADGTTIIGLGTDRTSATGARLRVGDSLGQLWESADAGASWERAGVPAVAADPTPLGYRIAFDPADLDHALFGEAGGGAHVTFDGGASWQTSSGLSASGGRANAFQIAVAPADPAIVWAQGIDLADLDPEHARQMYRSADGGNTFTSLFSESPEVTLVNGPTMAPHPTDPDILYFVFGTNYNNEGTWLYRYDHATGLVTRQHDDYHDIFAIEFLPGDPSVMYLGLTIEQI